MRNSLKREVKSDELEPITLEFMRWGKSITASQLIMAKNKIYQCLGPLYELLKEVDIFLTPALAQLPLKIGSLPTDDNFASYLQKNMEFSPFTTLFNQASLPAMTIPVMYHDHLPVSVQFAAAKGQDRLLLDLAMQLQKEFVDFTQPILAIY